MTSGELGILLRRWRTERGLSLGALALKARVNKSSLSRWEAGVNLPRVPELDAVLEALAVPPERRAEAFASLPAPRSVTSLRGDGTPPPLGGDLLRSMRLRRERTQEDVAAAIGVRQYTVARWERSEAWPTGEHLQSLCHELGAHPAETEALARGRFALAGHEAGPTPLDEAARRYFGFVLRWSAGDALVDLSFLSVEAKLWPLARHPGPARSLLGDVMARHAQVLADAGRFTEAREYASRVTAAGGAGTSGDFPLRSRYVARIALAEAAQKSGRTPAAREARSLRAWIGNTPYLPYFTPWAMSQAAHLVARAGDTSGAIALADEACSAAERDGDRDEFWFRTRDLAAIRVRAGEPDRAASLLNAVTPISPRCEIVDAALWADVLSASGERDAAQGRLREAFRLADEHRISHLRPRLKALSRRL